MQNLNNNKNIIFIWIPKCAGNSIESVLSLEHQVRQYNQPNWKYSFKNNCDVTFGHVDIELLLKENILSSYFYNNSFKFCIVRNPYDRAVSLFFYCRLNKKYTFKSWIDYLYKNKNNIPKNNLINENWFKDDNGCNDLCNKWNPMYTWIPHDIDKIYYFEKLGEIIDDVLNETSKNSKCGRYWKYSNSSNVYWSNSYPTLNKDIEFKNEKDYFSHRVANNFPRSWSNILTVFSDDNKLKIPCKNKSNHKHYTSYYDEDTQEKVYEIYKADFISFKYSKILKV